MQRKNLWATMFALFTVGGCHKNITPDPAIVFSKMGQVRLLHSNAGMKISPSPDDKRSRKITGMAVFADLTIEKVEKIDALTSIVLAEHKSNKGNLIYLVDDKSSPKLIFTSKLIRGTSVDVIQGQRVILITLLTERTVSLKLLDIDTRKMEQVYQEQYDGQREPQPVSVLWTKRYIVIQNFKKGSYKIVDVKTHAIEDLKIMGNYNSFRYCDLFVPSANGELAASVNTITKPRSGVTTGIALIDVKQRQIAWATEETGNQYQHQFLRWTSAKSFLFYRQNAQGSWDLYSLSLP